MAQYRITGPDGAQYNVTAPDEASQDQVLAYAQQQFTGSQARAQRLKDQQDADRELYAPTNGMSTSDKFFSGAGKAVADVGRGVGSLARKALPESMADSIGLPTQADIDDARRLDAPLMRTGAGLAGNIAGNVAMTLLPAGAVSRGASLAGLPRVAAGARAFINPQSYKAAAATGATLGALQPVASDESRLFNTTVGAATGGLGQATVNALGRVATPVKNALSTTQQKAVNLLSDAGVPLDLAQVTGSPTWQRVRSALGDNLFTAGGEADKRATQQAAFNKAVLDKIGADSTAATSDVMGASRDRINKVFEDVLSRNHVTLDPSTATRLATTYNDALGAEKAPVARKISQFLDLAAGNNGVVPGQASYAIKKDLDLLANSNDSTLKHYAAEARSAIMDAINGSLSGADQKAFAQARGQFSNMKKIEGAVASDGAGDISPSKLANVASSGRNRQAAVYGTGPQDLIELAQAGKQVLPDRTPNSGTAARLLASAAPGALVGLGTGLYTGDWTKAAEYGGASVAAPKALQFLLNNPTAVSTLSSGVQQPTVRSLVTLPQRSVAAAQLLRQTPSALEQLLLAQSPALQ